MSSGLKSLKTPETSSVLKMVDFKLRVAGLPALSTAAYLCFNTLQGYLKAMEA